MPELTNSSVLSPAGTRLELGTMVWPRSAKNSTKRLRRSVADIHVILGSRSGTGLGIGEMVAALDVGPRLAAAGVANASPERGAGDGRADEGAHGEAPVEVHATDGVEDAVDHAGACGFGSAPEPGTGGRSLAESSRPASLSPADRVTTVDIRLPAARSRRSGTRTARMATSPIPSHAKTDAEIRWNSPIRSGSTAIRA